MNEVSAGAHSEQPDRAHVVFMYAYMVQNSICTAKLWSFEPYRNFFFFFPSSMLGAVCN